MGGKLSNGGKYSLLAILIIFLYSCTNNSKNDAAFRMLSEGLETSNISIARSTETIRYLIEEKLNDPTTWYSAEIWGPRAEKVSKLSKDMFDYIKRLKSEVEKEKRLSDTKATELYTMLLSYKNNVLDIDSSLKMEFGEKTIITASSFDPSKHTLDDFYDAFFKGLSAEATETILTKFENNIRIIENRMALFCNNKIPEPERFYQSYLPLAYQNSSYVRRGDKLEITAGIGAFSLRSRPLIIINNKNIELETDGAAHYKFNAPNEPGKYSVPVITTYMDQDGKKETVSKILEYTVIE